MVNEESSSVSAAGPAFERHYSVKDISGMWGLGVDLIRRIFADEEGVIRIRHPEILHKRGYTTLSIPESVVRRVHRRLTQTRPGKPN
jgi:hypothetical protein